MGEYIPAAPTNDQAREHNENLPGMGGVFNTVNLHVYHYAGNNPVKYTDPDGRDIIHLLDPDAAMGFGHSAALVGDNKNGWLYYSNNGKESVQLQWFKTDKAFFEKYPDLDNGYEAFRYIEAQRVSTTSVQDEKMQKAAFDLAGVSHDKGFNARTNDMVFRLDKDSRKTKYNLFFNNCSEDVARIAFAGELGASFPLIPKLLVLMDKDTYRKYLEMQIILNKTCY